jgi:hypothetical protein
MMNPAGFSFAMGARWHLYGGSYHGRTPMIYAARSYVILEVNSRPELSDVHIIRGPAQLDARMPTFVTAFLWEQWR